MYEIIFFEKDENERKTKWSSSPVGSEIKACVSFNTVVFLSMKLPHLVCLVFYGEGLMNLLVLHTCSSMQDIYFIANMPHIDIHVLTGCRMFVL